MIDVGCLKAEVGPPIYSFGFILSSNFSPTKDEVATD